MSEVHELTVWVAGVAIDALVEFEADYCRPDPSVGFGGGHQIDLIRVVALDGRILTLTPKEVDRVEGAIADDLDEKRMSDAERRQAAAEERWESEREERAIRRKFGEE